MKPLDDYSAQNISASNSQNRNVQGMITDDDTILGNEDFEGSTPLSVDGADFVVAKTASKMTTSDDICQQQVADVHVLQDENQKGAVVSSSQEDVNRKGAVVSSQEILELSGGVVVVKGGRQQQQQCTKNIRGYGGMQLDEIVVATTKADEVVRDEETFTEPEPKHLCAGENGTWVACEDRSNVIGENEDEPSSGLEGKQQQHHHHLIHGGGGGEEEEIVGGYSNQMMYRQPGHPSKRRVAAKQGGSKDDDAAQISSSSVCRDTVSNNIGCGGDDSSPPPSLSTEVRVCFTGNIEAEFIVFLTIFRIKHELLFIY